MFRTSNPTLSEKAISRHSSAVLTETMTLEGTVNKSTISILLTMAAAYWSYTTPSLGAMSLVCIIAGLICALTITFKQSLAPLLTPVYAVAEGILLGTISLYSELQFPGIAFQAIGLTFGALFCLLIGYRSGLIKVSEKFRSGVMIATMAIALFYLVALVASLFGANFSFLHDSSPLSIGISVFVVGIAAMNLLLDFDLIKRLADSGSQPKYMEWYGAFALLVTLVWLYLEILNLLRKLQRD